MAAAEAAHPGTPAAAWLMSFRQSPVALDTAKAVLEASSSTLAQFQAVLVIRDVMVAHWDSLTPVQQGLKTQLLGYLLVSFDRYDLSLGRVCLFIATPVWAPCVHTVVIVFIFEGKLGLQGKVRPCTRK